MRCLTLSSLLATTAAMAQFHAGNLEQNLKAIDCDTLVVVQSDAIRDSLYWSPDSKSLGVKVDGKWVGINLDTLMVKGYKWRDGQNVAKPIGKPAYVPLTDEVRNEWKVAIQEESMQVRTKSGTLVELRNPEPGWVVLLVTTKAGGTREVWRTRKEDCTGLVVSPDEKWVAYIAGVHGAVVMRLP